MATLTLHIGTMKTGSTYIQNYLAKSRSDLLENGWVFPDFIETPNQSIVSAAFASDQLNRLNGFPSLASEDARETTRRELAEAISVRVETDQRWIISSENFANQLVNVSEIELLRSFFSEWFDEVRAVVYFRRQDQMLVSILSEKFKHFGMKGDRSIPAADWPWIQDQHDAFATNHLGTFRLWEAGLGEGNVVARPYLEAMKSGSQILDDFRAAVGIPEAVAGTREAKTSVNFSLSAEGIAFIKRTVDQAPEFFKDPTQKAFDNPAEQRIADAMRPFVPAELAPADPRWELRPNTPYFHWAAFDKAVVSAVPGPIFTPTQETLDQINEFYAEPNRELAHAAGDDAAWAAWVEQEPREVGVTEIPVLTDERFHELLERVSATQAPTPAPRRPAEVTPRSGLRARLGRIRRSLKS